MYSQIDRILFPNWCEVYQTASHQYVYPIFKNGTNTLKEKQKEKKWKIFLNEQIKKINTITVFWRPSFERFVSGVNSYIQWECEENKNLDKKTVLHFVKKYHFLDRHFCPQYFWLINLNRYMSHDSKLLIKSITELDVIVDDLNLKPNWLRPGTHLSPSQDLIDDLENFKDSTYLRMDDILFDRFQNKEVSFLDLKELLKKNHLWNVLD